MKKYLLLFVMFIFFYSLAFVLWQTLDEIFYLYNFIIIGTCLGLGIGLWPVFPQGKKHIARLISQLAVGGYMFFGLGFGLIYLIFGHITPENMQIEGFWFWLLSGTFMAAVIHYLIAKMFGTLLFGRAWCGWACWTAAVLDLLPWKKSPGRINRLKSLPFILFLISASLVLILVFVFGYGIDTTLRTIIVEGNGSNISEYVAIPELLWFIFGNIIYYTTAVILAYILKDNRAFCKYVCPITLFMRIGSRFSVLKIAACKDNCTGCCSCERSCPMDIEILRYIKEGKRILSTDCILCQTCISKCKSETLKISCGLDAMNKNYIRNIE